MTTIPFPRPGAMTAKVQVDVGHSAAPRQPASAVPSIKGLRISPPGFKATLVDISPSGLLAEWGVALKIGQAVTVDFEGTFSPKSLAAHVVRSAVASMTSGGVRYYVGLAFNAPIAFEEPPRPETSGEDDTVQAAVADPLQSDDVENCW